jgi:Tfp pilus assembly protein PilF
MKRTRTLLAVALLAAATVAGPVGCAQDQKPAKKQMTEKWNAVRAGVMYGMAKQQFESGDLDKGRDSVNQALKMDPRHVPSLILAARIAVEQNRLEDADRALTLARTTDPKNPETDYFSGVVYQRWQQPQKAYDYYQSAAEKAPAELPYLLAKAEMLTALDRQQDALDLLLPKVAYFEHSAAIRDAAGQLLLQAGKPAQAVDLLRQATILAADDLTLKEHLGLALFYAGQHRDAVDVLTKLTKDAPYNKRGDLLMALGESQMQLGKDREARETFETASQVDPSSPKVWLGLGKAALALNDPKRADLALRKAISLDGASGEAQLMLGYVRLRQDKMSEALTAFKKAATIDSTDPVSLTMVGYVYEKMGSKNQAMDYYGKALKLKPNDELASKLMAGVDVTE